jgi:hypothetical protein
MAKRAAMSFLFVFRSMERRGADESLWTEQEEQFPEIILILTLLWTPVFICTRFEILLPLALTSF